MKNDCDYCGNKGFYYSKGWAKTCDKCKNMELKDQVCSLELAKRLKELGVKQESYFVWSEAYEGFAVTRRSLEEELAAFTVAEVGNILRLALSGNILQAYGEVFNIPDTRMITSRGMQICMTEPDVGAKMLIYLIENKLITI